MQTLVIAEYDHKGASDALLSTISAVRELGAPIHVLVAGDNVGAIAQSVATIDGVQKVLVADAPVYAHTLAESVAPLVAHIAKDYSAIAAPATTTGKNLLPRLSALLDTDMVSDIVKVVSGDTFVHPIYAGNALATVQNTAPIKIMSVRASAFTKANFGNNAPIETVNFIADAPKSAFVGQELAQSVRPELSSARVVISGGRALGSKENFDKYLEPVADKLGAAIGASRAAVDAGFAPNDLQVGQTGKIVAPDLYIAVGISGAIQHLAGMKDSKVIVAINQDPEAPMAQLADYYLQADAMSALDELAQKLPTKA